MLPDHDLVWMKQSNQSFRISPAGDVKEGEVLHLTHPDPLDGYGFLSRAAARKSVPVRVVGLRTKWLPARLIVLERL
jgi:hypothetical protein